MSTAVRPRNRVPTSLAILVLAWLQLGYSTSATAEVRVSAADGRLWASYEVEGVFEAGIWSSLHSGLPSRVVHRVSLWESRSALWDRRVAEWTSTYRVVFDLIEETYDLFDDAGLLESNLDPPEVEDRVSIADDVPLVELDSLDEEGSYYVRVEVEVQPLTVHEVRELEHWLNGRIRGSNGLGGLSSQVIGMFKSQVGLGERKRSLRSGPFGISDLSRREASKSP